MLVGVPLFDQVVDDYEDGRAGYPARLFEAIGPLRGQIVIEGGAGTGIATRQLQDAGATVIAVDNGPQMLARAVGTRPSMRAVVADAAVLPFTAGCADLVAFAQSWHWLDSANRCHEVARVLRDGGRWAAWWNHSRADGEEWYDRYWDAIEQFCPVADRSHRDLDWGSDVATSGVLGQVLAEEFDWTREVSTRVWMQELRSFSYVAALSAEVRGALVEQVTALLAHYHPSGQFSVQYRTNLWTAFKATGATSWSDKPETI